MLTGYLQQTQRLLHDASNQFWQLPDLTVYVNIARGRVASEGQCVRVLAPCSGPITGVSVTTGGTKYTAPTVVAAGGLGTGAIITATQVGGIITSATVAAGGSNYLPPVSFTISDATGTGATIAPTQAGVLQTVAGQEVYTFATANSIVQQQSGVASILNVQTIAVSWGSLKPTLQQMIWSDFQAYVRSYSIGMQGQPAVWAQYAQGENGSVYMWPWPSSIMGMDWDCVCTPITLVADTDPEAIPTRGRIACLTSPRTLRS